MKETKGKCPHCGKKITFLDYDSRQWYYGSPIRKCKKCKNEYLDRRYHEIVLDGDRGINKSIISSIVMMIIGGFILYRGIYLLDYKMGYSDNMPNLYSYFFIPLGIVVTILGIIDVIRILFGFKEKRIEKLREESKKRLSNYDYANKLSDMGYIVPDEFLE